MGKLTDEIIAAAAPTAVLSDGHGLRLRMTKRQWQVRIKGSDRVLGTYREMSIEEARQAAQQARLQAQPVPVAIPPAADAPAGSNGKTVPTFGAVAGEWLTFDPNIKPATRRMHRLRLRHLAPLHRYPVDQIDDAEHIRPVLMRIFETSGAETATRCANIVERVFRHARVAQRIKFTPPTDLRAMVPTTVRKNRAAILDQAKLRELIDDLDLWVSRFGHTVTNAARVQARTCLRTGEVIGARWQEIDLLAAVWHVPAERMKMGKPFSVPLSSQSIEILREQWKLWPNGPGPTDYVFPHFTDHTRHMSDGALRNLVHERAKTIGRHDPHGWRAAMQTAALKAVGADGKPLFDVILTELALSHKPKGLPYGSAYFRDDLLEQRRGLAQWWSDWLEGKV